VTEVAEVIRGVEGWCTVYKAAKLYELAALPDTKLAIEIGVFGGKSLLPIAAAFKRKKAGRVFGIEPWDNAIAVETVTGVENDKWWSEVDLLAIKRHFFKRMTELKLEEYIKILELPSDAAILVFQSPRYNGKIDLVHIDGAHSLEQSVFDVTYWHRLCRRGGYIVVDDINWTTVGLAFEFLKGVADLVDTSTNDEQGHFAVFRKR
jgi:predicted O-methyltransferase YrrM